MLAHENIKTTQIYLDTLPNEMIDDATDKVLGAVQKIKQPNNKTKKGNKKKTTCMKMQVFFNLHNFCCIKIEFFISHLI